MGKGTKISLISTVLNESENIREFLNSIISQTKKPDEFIIVDGGSTDGTYEILKEYARKYKWIKVFVKKGCTIGEGRNYAIKMANNEIIAVCDAGCIYDKFWLEKIIKPIIDENADVVVGVYKPYYTNDFEFFQGILFVPSEEKIYGNPSRMSSRCIAFKKEVWKKVGGYPNSSAGEDTLFNLKVLSSDFKIHFTKSAIVYWRMRRNLKEVFKQFYRYGAGDKCLGNVMKIKKLLFLLLSFWGTIALTIYGFLFYPLLAFFILFLLFFYLLLNGIKAHISTKKLKALFYVPLLLLVKRIGYCLGATFG